MFQRPSWLTGSLVPSPPGITWTYTPSGWRDGARGDYQPPSNYLGGVTQAVTAEPAYYIPQTDGWFVAPAPHQLPDLASVIRALLLGVAI